MTPEQENELLNDTSKIKELSRRLLQRAAITVDLLIEDNTVTETDDLFIVAVGLQAIATKLKFMTRDLQYRTRQLICGDGDGV